jgi:two-component sensor histidine kinase
MATDPLLPSQPADSLALAVVASSNEPLLLLDAEENVIAASHTFCAAFLGSQNVDGRPLSSLGSGEWNVAQLSALLQATASGFADVAGYEMDLKRPGLPTRQLVLHAHKLDYAGAQQVRIILAVSDMTERRLGDRQKDDLVREKAILLQELQHRVANSLQIIASVLLQSARSTPSDETRAYLSDAHDRVMSVASLQRQLAASTLGEVELKKYFTDLCRSIGASMIHDRSLISIVVDCDDSLTTADTSVSLGLIVTELVINGLKHAFPAKRPGTITVAYHAHNQSWSLTVCDDGVGMPVDRESKPGLGTSIVEALARQLSAEISVSDGKPGTHVRVGHEDLADGEALTNVVSLRAPV